MLSIMKLTDEAVGVVDAKYGQGVITIGDFAQLNEKSVEGLCRVLLRPGGTTRGGGGVQSWGFSVSDGWGEPTRHDILYIYIFKGLDTCSCTHMFSSPGSA